MENQENIQVGEESVQTVEGKKSFSPKIVIILVLVVASALLIVGIYALSGKQTKTNLSNSQQASLTPQPQSSVKPKIQYENPFDKKTQYINPFAQYKNPFDSL